jgi:hypothetical protein
MALVAAPLRTLSEQVKRFRVFGCAASRRTRPTRTEFWELANCGVGRVLF